MEVVVGIPELMRKLKTLPDKLRKQGGRKAMVAAAKPIVKATKANVSVERTGLLKQSIGSVTLLMKTGDYGSFIGARRMKGVKKKGMPKWVGKKVRKRMASADIQLAYPARYEHLIEKGTKHMRAHPFLAPGLAQAIPQSIEATRMVLKEFIEQAARE